MFSNERKIDKKHLAKIVRKSEEQVFDAIKGGIAFAWSIGICSNWNEWLEQCTTCYECGNEIYAFIE